MREPSGNGLEVSCPKCGHNASKWKFPDEKFRPVFEMMIECSKTKRAILVLILAQTAFEAMLDAFLWRLLDRWNCPEDVQIAITNRVKDVDAKRNLIESLTGREFKKMAKDAGFKYIWRQFNDNRTKRNSFLHTAEAKDLTLDDIKRALRFASDTVDLYAGLFSNYREWKPSIEEDPPF